MLESSQYLLPPIANKSLPLYVELQHYHHAGQLFYSHWHEHMELILMTEGEITLTCNANVIQAKAGDLLIINPNDVHHFSTTQQQVSYYCIAFDLSFLKGSQMDDCDVHQIIPLASNHIAFHHIITGNEDLTRLVQAVIEEYENQLPAYPLAIKARLYDILAILFRRYLDLAPGQSHAYKRRSHLTTIRQILDYIHTHYTEDLDLKQLAAQFNVSYYHLLHLFKDYTGRSLLQYVTAMRLDKATQLLNHTDLTITEVAAAVGYSDMNYFSRLYKKDKGKAPSRERAPSA